MLQSRRTVLLAVAVLTSLATAQVSIDPNLVGTWSTKSHSVFTGPGFYDPVTEKMTEPALTGISYSFTADGYYEEAYYRAISNPTSPSCPAGIMQWQHGTYVQLSNGSLVLTPFSVDGRQLLSQPCQSGNSVFTRYNQSELFERYSVYTDPYHNVLRLDLYQFNGAAMNPMYIAYSPPQMLPTSTLNPTTASTTAGSKSTSSSKLRRSFTGENTQPLKKRTVTNKTGLMDADNWWWVGVGLTAIGSVGYFWF